MEPGLPMAYFRFIVRHPILVVLLLVIVTACSFLPIARLEVDNSIDNWLLENDPGIQAYRDFRREFQNDEYVVIGYEPTGGVLGAKGLALAQRLTARLQQIDGVLAVDSIANIEEIRAKGDLLSVAPLVRPPLNKPERRRILEKLTTDRLYNGSFASADGSAGVILVTVARVENNNVSRRWRIIDDIRQTLSGETGPFYLTGRVIFDAALFHSMVSDQRRLIPLMVAIFVVVLGALFRTVTGVLLPSVTVGISIVWTFALLQLTGFTLNVVAAILPVVLLAIGVADSVHVISEYQEELRLGREKKTALLAALDTVLIPCLFTSVTTALGFLGLLLIRVAPLREFGLFAAAGTMLAFVATFSLLPSALSLLPSPPPRHHRSNLARSWSLARLFEFVANHRTWILAASLLFVLLGLSGLPRVRTSANWYKYLKPDHPVIVATDFVENSVGGIYAVELLVTPKNSASAAESVKDHEAMLEMDKLQQQIEAEPIVERVISPADFVKVMNRTMHADDPAYERIPANRDAIGQLLLMYELDAPDGRLYDYLNFDFSHARITARARMSGGDDHGRLLDHIRRLTGGLEHVDAIPTGLMALYNDVERHMLRGMVSGFCVAFVAVSIMMTLLLRTLRHGLLAMIPGVMPIVFIVGMTGWFGIALGTMPAMMGNVALGIAVDNAIHMLTRYRRLRTLGSPAREAIGRAVTVVGRPVLFTTVVLCLGFGVLGFSELVPNQYFGTMTAVVLLGSLVGALVTLPATILMVDELSPKAAAESARRLSHRAKTTDPALRSETASRDSAP